MKDSNFLFPLPEYNLKPNPSVINKAKPRLNSPQRNQIEFVNMCIDDLIPEDHQARSIWNYVKQMDLSLITNKIQSTSATPGRPATDPQILLSLWIYAMAEGIGSARVINKYCSEHLAFKWICGGVAVNSHTISDFRKENADEFDELVSMTIARLMEKDLITLKRISQDGMRVRANAGSSSSRRRPKLKELLIIAREQLKALNDEIDADPSVCMNRQLAAKKRCAEDRKKRIEQALEENRKLIMEKNNAKRKQRKTLTEQEKKEVRTSTTDPTARKMKMANGGFNQAYNVQLAVDTKSRFIIGLSALNKNNDFGKLPEMFEQVKKRYSVKPKEWLVDQGYLVSTDVVKVQEQGCKVYMNPSDRGKRGAHMPREHEGAELTEWRVRMGTEEAKEIYKDRASNSEWANAGMRNRGLKQFLVRGLQAVKGVVCLHVLTHNILRAIILGYGW